MKPIVQFPPERETESPSDMRKRTAVPSPILGQALTVFTSPAKSIGTQAQAHYRSRYHDRYRFARWVFFADLALLGLIVSLAAFSAANFLARPRVPETIRVLMRTSPELPRSGERITLSFDYANRSRIRQEEVRLTLRLPRGFLIDEIVPERFDRESRTFDAGMLGPGEGGSFEIGGILIAFPDVPAEAVAIVRSRHTRTGAREVRAVELPIPVGPSALAGELSLPDVIVAGEKASISFSFRNEGNAEISEAVIVPLFPEGVQIEESEPAPIDGAWRIFGIQPGDAGTLAITLRIPEGSSAIPLFVRVALRAQDELVPQGEIGGSVPFLAPRIQVSSEMLGDGPIAPGEVRTFKISASNDGATLIRDASIYLQFDPPWVSVVPERGVLLADAEFAITSSEIPELAAFGPGARIETEVPLRFSIPTDDVLKLLEESLGPLPHPFTLRRHLFLEGDVEGAGIIRITAEDEEIAVKSAIKIAAAARYYTPEGEQIGRGPLPPRVGRATRYWIFIEPKAAPNGARDIIVEGKLPPEVSWINLQSVSAPGGGSVRYDAARRIVRWELSALPTTTDEPYGAAFAVELVPRSADIGGPTVLFQNITVRGIDEPTGAAISGESADVTTELSDDPRTEKQGIIVP